MPLIGILLNSSVLICDKEKQTQTPKTSRTNMTRKETRWQQGLAEQEAAAVEEDQEKEEKETKDEDEVMYIKEKDEETAKAEAAGDHQLQITAGEETLTKVWSVGGEPRKVSPIRTQSWESILYPAEGGLPGDSVVYEVRMDSIQRDLGWLPSGELASELLASRASRNLRRKVAPMHNCMQTQLGVPLFVGCRGLARKSVFYKLLGFYSIASNPIDACRA